MATIIFLILLVGGEAYTPPVAEVFPRFRGTLAGTLSHRDKVQIRGLCTQTGSEVWFVEVDPVLPESSEGAWVAVVYLVPDRSTDRLRRGRMMTLLGEVSRKRPQERVWMLDEHQGSYAQVSVEGRKFNTTSSHPETPQEQPFFISGEWQDEEIISLVLFIRTSPLKMEPTPSSPDAIPLPVGRVEGWHPIGALSRLQGGNFRVSIPRREGQGQLVELLRQGQKWVIVGISDWII